MHILFSNETKKPYDNACHRAYLIKIPPRPGFEPGTYRLTAECSTAELSRNILICMLVRHTLKTEDREGKANIQEKQIGA